MIPYNLLAALTLAYSFPFCANSLPKKCGVRVAEVAVPKSGTAKRVEPRRHPQRGLNALVRSVCVSECVDASSGDECGDCFVGTAKDFVRCHKYV